MRKFGRAAAGAASLANLLSITVPASAYTTGSAAPAPAATRAGTLPRIKPGGPMALPRNQSSAPRAFYGKTINVVSQNWGGYVAQHHGIRFRYVRAAFFVPYADCTSTPSSVTVACPSGSLCQRSSAEVISEAPSSGTSILALSNFRAESFTDVVVTNSHGQRAGLRAPGWDTFGVSTENNGGAVLDQPTQIFRGKAFDCYWMAQG